MQQSTDRLESTYAERVLRLQGIPELSIGQNVNSVGLIGPDQEASEWEANDVNPDEYDMETARNVAPQTPRPNRKRRASGSGSQRKRARTESIERQDVDELEEELSPPATSKAKGGKKPARATRKNVPKVVLPGPKGKKVPASKTPAKKAAPKKAATKKGKTSVQVLSDDDEDTAGEDQLEEDEASGTWTDEATASTIKHNTRSRAKRAK
ncbi:hypothetical protein BDV93DRAFT_564472 [Ceratobasidium sp. AG-I]|nr:hypothetical protein BDV93DRAFT_564472 [Ceratobasidium sp. AG-I]